MDKLSDKAKVIYATLENLNAIGEENKVNSYTILDYIIEEIETLENHILLKEITEEELMNISLEINLKSVSALLTSLVRKEKIKDVAPASILVEGTTRYLKQYFIPKK